MQSTFRLLQVLHLSMSLPEAISTGRSAGTMSSVDLTFICRYGRFPCPTHPATLEVSICGPVKCKSRVRKEGNEMSMLKVMVTAREGKEANVLNDGGVVGNMNKKQEVKELRVCMLAHLGRTACFCTISIPFERER